MNPLTPRLFTALAAFLVSVAPAAAFADSHAQERDIGQRVYNDLRSKGQIIDQSPYYPVLRRVGERISTAAEPHWYRMNFIVVKGDKPNAFSVPGGYVYVNQALLRNADNEDELAAVVGHETGHLVLGHVMNRIHQAQMYNLGLGILGLFIHSAGQANLANILANYSYLNFNRQQEYQADDAGVKLAARAGYNPWGAVWFFRKLEKMSGNAGWEQYVQDHPSSEDRISRLERNNAALFSSQQNKMPAVPGLPISDADTGLVLSGM